MSADTVFKMLNLKLGGGLQKGELTILCAYSNVGKSLMMIDEKELENSLRDGIFYEVNEEGE